MRVTSYSGITMFDQCPQKFKRTYILKEDTGPQPTEKNAPALFRGLRIHQIAEDFVAGKRDTLTKELGHRRAYLEDIMERGGVPEEEFNITHDWGMTDFEDMTGMVRGKIDCIIPPEDGVVHVKEYKTGKVYHEHAKQRGLYGLAALLLYPDAESTDVETVYFDQKGEDVTQTFTRGGMRGYQFVWERHSRKVWEADTYPMRPSFKCRWCPFSKTKGGTCPN